MKYITRVDNEEYVVEISQENTVLVNGEPYHMDFQQLAGSGVTSLLLNNRSLEAVVEERDGLWEVLIKGELYTVNVQDERAYRLAQARGGGLVDDGEATIKSPMPGIIIAVPVKQGDVVKKGDKIVILESMKMENELRAPCDGVVAQIQTEAGASVEKDQVLAIIISDDEEA